MYWTIRQRIFFLIVILALTGLSIAGVTITLLYQTAFEEEEARLSEIAETQARLMEAVARFDQLYSAQDHPQGSSAATLSQIIDAHKHNTGFGQTGEMTLARREGDQILWIVNHRHFDFDKPEPVPMAGRLAEPMRQALSGKSGIMVGLDYRSEMVLAAYQPIALLNIGLVAKIDLQEIRTPFIQAGVVTAGVGLFAIAIGGFLLFGVSHPIIVRLEESEARTRAIVTHAADGIITANESGTIETFNATAEHTFLYPAREVIGQNIGILIPKPENEKHQGYIDAYLRTGQKKIIGFWREVTAQRRDGTTFPMSIAVSEVMFGKRRLFTALVRDLTEEKMAERNLTTQYAVARILAECTTIQEATPKILQAVCSNLGWQLGALWQVDKQAGLLHCLEVWCTSPQQFTEFVTTTKNTVFPMDHGLPGRVWTTGQPVWIPDVVKDTNFPRAHIANKENLHAAFAFPVKLGEATYGIMEFFSFHIHEPDETLLRQMSAVGSQFGQFIERLQGIEEIANMAKFPEENPSPVIRVSRDGTVLYRNQPGKGFLAALEDQKDEQLKTEWKQFIHEAFSLGKIQRREITCKDRFFSVTTSAIAGADYLNVYALDITDRRQAEEALRQGEEQRRQAQKLEAIGTLAGGIAHDFNNILTAILGYTELAIAKAGTNSPISSKLQEVLNAGGRAKDLVKQILTFSCEQTTGKRPINIQPIIEEALKLLGASLPSSIVLRKDLKANAGPIFGDPTQIHQIVMNLGTNAEYAMRGTTGSLEVTVDEVEIDSMPADHTPGLVVGPYVRLTMADSGPGIPPEVISRIFDPFFTTKPVGEGSGMGLSATHGIVSDHHGAISVHSVQGSGTTFILYFPRTFSSLQESIPKIPSSIPRGEGTLLFVDDERAIVEFSKSLLEGLGYQVLAYTNSLDAIEAFRHNPKAVDVIITDQTMPDCTGEMLAQKMLGIRPDIPIILCTGFSHIMTEKKALSMGVRAFLLKPFSTEDLAQTIQRVLARDTDKTEKQPLKATQA